MLELKLIHVSKSGHRITSLTLVLVYKNKTETPCAYLIWYAIIPIITIQLIWLHWAHLPMEASYLAGMFSHSSHLTDAVQDSCGTAVEAASRYSLQLMLLCSRTLLFCGVNGKSSVLDASFTIHIY